MRLGRAVKACQCSLGEEEPLTSSLILGSVSNKAFKALGLFTETQLGSTVSASLLISPPFYFNRLVIHHLAGLSGTC